MWGPPPDQVRDPVGQKYERWLKKLLNSTDSKPRRRRESSTPTLPPAPARATRSAGDASKPSDEGGLMAYLARERRNSAYLDRKDAQSEQRGGPRRASASASTSRRSSLGAMNRLGGDAKASAFRSNQYTYGQRPGLSFFQHLPSGPAPVRVPPTLLQSGGESFLWLSTTDSGKLKRQVFSRRELQASAGSVARKLSRESYPGRSGDPCALRKRSNETVQGPYFLQCRTDTQLLHHSQDVTAAVEALASTPDPSDSSVTGLQKFIPCRGHTAWFVRAVAKARGKPSVWVFTDSDPHMTDASAAGDCSIVRGSGPNSWPEPKAVAVEVMAWLERERGIRFDELVLDLVQDPEGVWWLLQVKAFSGMEAPRSGLGPADSRSVASRSSRRSSRSAASTASSVAAREQRKNACPGQYCLRLTEMERLDASSAAEATEEAAPEPTPLPAEKVLPFRVLVEDAFWVQKEAEVEARRVLQVDSPSSSSPSDGKAVELAQHMDSLSGRDKARLYTSVKVCPRCHDAYSSRRKARRGSAPAAPPVVAPAPPSVVRRSEQQPAAAAATEVAQEQEQEEQEEQAQEQEQLRVSPLSTPTAAARSLAKAISPTKQQSPLGSPSKRLQMRCVWGCGQTLREADRLHHEQRECGRREVHCPLACGALGLWAEELPAHARTCPKRRVPCPLGCGADVAADVVVLHRTVQCAMRPVPCELGCGQAVGKADEARHQADDCDNRLVRCRQNCSRRLRACELAAHEAMCRASAQAFVLGHLVCGTLFSDDEARGRVVAEAKRALESGQRVRLEAPVAANGGVPNCELLLRSLAMELRGACVDPGFVPRVDSTSERAWLELEPL